MSKRVISDIQGIVRGLGITNFDIGYGKKHIKVTVSGPHGTRKVFSSVSPSDRRTALNLRAELRRAGQLTGAIKTS